MLKSKSIFRLKAELKEFETDPPIGCSGGLEDTRNLYKWHATIIGPSSSPYSGGIFNLSIDIPETYPLKPPKIKFVTPILHPNINSTGSICLDILNKNWSPVLKISKVLLSISSLLTDPNPDDPLDKPLAELFKKNKEKYSKIVRNHTLRHAI